MTSAASNDSNEALDAQLGLKRFAKIAVKSLQNNYYNPAEPFEMFAERTESQIVDQLKADADRMVRGYEALLKELSKEK